MAMRTPETTRKHMINALVGEKYAVFIAFEELEYRDGEIVYGRSTRGVAKYTEYIEENQTAKERYRAHLNTLSRAELEEAFSKLPIRQPGEFDGHFIDQPFADAEYDYWALCPAWSMEQATALLLGKDADVVDVLALRQFRVSAFKTEFDRLLYRLQEAKERGELTEPVSPPALIEWASAYQIEAPSELIQVVEAHSHDTVTRPVSASAMPDERPVTPNERTAWAKERESLKKIIIAMAVDGYGYVPGSAKSKLYQEVVDAAERLGIKIDRDTVSKWVKESTELLDHDVINDLASKH
jgi:hypothetical protein